MHATTNRPMNLRARGMMRLTPCLLMALAGSGCASLTPATERQVVSVRPACEAVKPVCPVAADPKLTDGSSARILKNNEAMRAMCGQRWADQCRKAYGPPAPMPKPSTVPQVEAKTS